MLYITFCNGKGCCYVNRVAGWSLQGQKNNTTPRHVKELGRFLKSQYFFIIKFQFHKTFENEIGVYYRGSNIVKYFHITC